MINLIILGIFGTSEIILVVLVVLLMFGGKKIPEMMKGLGKGMKEFKDASAGNDAAAAKEDGAAPTANTTA